MRAARALSKPLESNKMALRPCVCQGIFRASIAPHTEASVAASNISYCFCNDIESWCPYVGETMGAQLNMGVLDDLP